MDDPLPAGFPLAVNFLVAAAFFGPVAGGDRLGLSFADGGAVTNFPAHLRCNISGQIFGRTPPDAIVTCFRSYINQIFRNNNTSYMPVPVALMVASSYLTTVTDIAWVQLVGFFMSRLLAAYALRLISRTGKKFQQYNM